MNKRMKKRSFSRTISRFAKKLKYRCQALFDMPTYVRIDLGRKG